MLMPVVPETQGLGAQCLQAPRARRLPFPGPAEACAQFVAQGVGEEEVGLGQDGNRPRKGRQGQGQGGEAGGLRQRQPNYARRQCSPKPRPQPNQVRGVDLWDAGVSVVARCGHG